MNTKDAIEFLGKEIKSRTLYCGGIIVGFEESPRDKKLTQVIELLQRGEKYEAMWGEFRFQHGDFPMDEDIDIATQMNNFEQKYFQEKKNILDKICDEIDRMVLKGIVDFIDENSETIIKIIELIEKTKKR